MAKISVASFSQESKGDSIAAIWIDALGQALDSREAISFKAEGNQKVGEAVNLTKKPRLHLAYKRILSSLLLKSRSQRIMPRLMLGLPTASNS